jgi:methylamine dehydrogenase accessory protein MauD
MDLLILLARLVLSAVFMVAGVAKLADRAGTRQSMTGFGVPPRAANFAGLLLSLVELIVATLLLSVSLAWFGAAAALLLLLVFSAAIAMNLASGRRPDCHCFGQLYSSPAGWPTLARNVALGAVAAFIVLRGPEDSGASIGGLLLSLPTHYVVTLIVGTIQLVLVGVVGIILFQVIRQHGRLLMRLDALEARAGGDPIAATAGPGLPIGSPAPTFRLRTTDGQSISLNGLLLLRKPVLCVFTNPTCGPCQALMPSIAHFQRGYAESITVVVVSEGSLADNHGVLAASGLTRVLLQEKREVAESYQAHGTPAAVVIQPNGHIGSSLAFGAEAIQRLFARIAGHLPARMPSAPPPNSGELQAPRLVVGDPAPSTQLQDLEGKTFSLMGSRGQRTLLIFWNPDCGFCQSMLSGLRRFEDASLDSVLLIVIISTGSVEANRAMNLRSTIILDKDSQLGAAFGARGTPMGMLLDADGKVASTLVAGGAAVLDLARSASGSFAAVAD